MNTRTTGSAPAGAVRVLGTIAGATALAGIGWAAARRARQLDLSERVALVTGGSRGLGLLIARELLAAGAKVALVARDEETLARAAAQLNAPGRTLTVPCDIRETAAVADAVALVERELGPVDVLVNDAGLIQVGPVEHMTRADHEEAMGVHFWGPLALIEAVLPGMRARRLGRIVNVTSIGGKVAVPHLLPYAASKFALVGLSEGLRAELAGTGVKVTTVVPGLMRTGSPPNALFKGQHRREYAWFVISDSLPGLSMNAERAARRIVAAARRGDAELVLGLPARAAAVVQGIAPGLLARTLGLVNRAVLPSADESGERRRTGRQSESRITRSFLTAPTRRAAARTNQ